jgi:putative transposase
LEVRKPKAPDRGATAGVRIRFTSNILPKWTRRTKSPDALLFDFRVADVMVLI